MHLLLVGISHRTAPVDLRERIDFQTRGVGQALRGVAGLGSTREAVIVSTCNRAEIYAAADDLPRAASDLVDFIGGFSGVSHADIEPHVYRVEDVETARHLFRVAAGLDS